MQDIARTMVRHDPQTGIFHARCLAPTCKGEEEFQLIADDLAKWTRGHAHPTFSKGDRVRLTRKFWEELGLTRYESETQEVLTVDHVKDNGMIHCQIGTDGKRHMFWDADDLELVTD